MFPRIKPLFGNRCVSNYFIVVNPNHGNIFCCAHMIFCNTCDNAEVKVYLLYLLILITLPYNCLTLFFFKPYLPLDGSLVRSD